MFSKSNQDVNNLALKYLEHKYGETFEYKQPCGNSMTGTRNFIASCLGHGDVLVQIDNFKDSENRVFLDNHIAKKYENETKNFIKEIFDKEFTESKIFYIAAEKVLSEDLPGDATFEQFLADPEGRISAVIAVKKSGYSDNTQFKEAVETILESFAANWIGLHIHVVEDNEFDSFNKSTHEEMFLNRQYVKYAHLSRQNGKTNLEILSNGGELDERIEL
ncbi:MAG: hypothetical protein NC452_06455 [Eubacterium sp.]|nr:hypothetical protein [Eubacterium sp.]